MISRNKTEILLVTGFFLALVIFCPFPLAAAGKKLSVGINLGGRMMTGSANTWQAGIDVAFHLCRHVTVSASVSHSTLNLESEIISGDYKSSTDQKWSTTPLALSLLYRTPLSEKATFYLGGGAGNHPFTLTETTETNLSGELETTTTKSSFHGFAPHLVLGMEITCSDRISLKSNLSYTFGVATRENVMNRITTRQDVNFGGPSLTLGVCYYLL